LEFHRNFQTDFENWNENDQKFKDFVDRMIHDCAGEDDTFSQFSRVLHEIFLTAKFDSAESIRLIDSESEIPAVILLIKGIRMHNITGFPLVDLFYNDVNSMQKPIKKRNNNMKKEKQPFETVPYDGTILCSSTVIEFCKKILSQNTNLIENRSPVIQFGLEFKQTFLVPLYPRFVAPQPINFGPKRGLATTSLGLL